MGALPLLVTFDCAQTLVDVRWAPQTAMRDCATRLGIELPDEAFVAYGRLFHGRLAEYGAVNLSGDVRELEEFWWRLGRDWLAEHGDPGDIDRFLAAASELAYGPEQVWFRAYEDATPCLRRLKELGYKLAVVSNWDLSLNRILRTLDLEPYFDEVVISLQEGVEKPEPRLFEIAMERVGVPAAQTLHIGDNPVDDGDGAERAGIRRLLIDRSAEATGEGQIRSLEELPEAFAWSV